MTNRDIPLRRQNIEVTAAECVILLFALQDYSRFTQNAILQKIADKLFFAIDAQRRVDHAFFQQSLDAGEFFLGTIKEQGDKNNASKAH